LGIFTAVGLSNNLTTLINFLFFSIIFSVILYYFKNKYVPRYIGILLLVFYFSYLYFLII
ncbi:MAG: hypothetical protein WEC80_02685, partial [Patescibacteria group bacterium]